MRATCAATAGSVRHDWKGGAAAIGLGPLGVCVRSTRESAARQEDERALATMPTYHRGQDANGQQILTLIVADNEFTADLLANFLNHRSQLIGHH